MIEKNKLGILCFIASEAFFFLLLIVSYVYLNSTQATGPTASSSLDPVKTGFFSLFLFSSSFTIWRADKNFSLGNRRRFSTWLLATILLGIIFLAGQGMEWARLISVNTTVSRDLFGTTFFTLTGFHGAHVLIGLIVLSIFLGLALAGGFKGTKSAGIEVASIYWHFVDVVWIFIYSVIYLQLLIARL